jgi:hypothetical protein
MSTVLTIAAYENLATATLVARTLAAEGIADDAVHLIAPPGLVPAEADRTVSDRLRRLGVPEQDAQILADMVQGGCVLIAVATSEGGEDYRRAAASLAAARPREPLLTIDTRAVAGQENQVSSGP